MKCLADALLMSTLNRISYQNKKTINNFWLKIKKKSHCLELNTVFTLSIGTPYLLSVFLQKFEIVHSTTCCDVFKILLYLWQTV